MLITAVTTVVVTMLRDIRLTNNGSIFRAFDRKLPLTIRAGIAGRQEY